MKLAEMTWPEVETYLEASPGILLPTGSTEQHGPIGLIGTDAICAQAVAEGVGETMNAIVAPTLALTPAPFNLAFPGTISVSPQTFTALVQDVLTSLAQQGFTRIYIVNGHGANIAPLRTAIEKVSQLLDAPLEVRLRSWWDYPQTDALRKRLYGDWEGMHGTPSEVAITQALVRSVTGAEDPPEKLSAEYIRDHAGDRHGEPAEHRRRFPDGRVGSHSALASPEQGAALLESAVREAAADYRVFLEET